MSSKNPRSDSTKFSIHLGPSTAEWVRQEAKKHGISMQSFIEAHLFAAMLRARLEDRKGEG